MTVPFIEPFNANTKDLTATRREFSPKYSEVYRHNGILHDAALEFRLFRGVTIPFLLRNGRAHIQDALFRQYLHTITTRERSRKR